jgi:hypothetical protein
MLKKSVAEMANNYLKGRMQGFTQLCSSPRKITFLMMKGGRKITLAVSAYDKDQATAHVDTLCTRRNHDDIEVMFERRYSVTCNEQRLHPVLDQAIAELAPCLKCGDRLESKSSCSGTR